LFCSDKANGVVNEDRTSDKGFMLLHCCFDNSENDVRQQQSDNEAETNTQHVSALSPLLRKRNRLAATKAQPVSALLSPRKSLKVSSEKL
jgi:hypothetical protein